MKSHCSCTAHRKPAGSGSLFPPEFLDFVRRVLPDERDHDVVHTVVVITGCRPF